MATLAEMLVKIGADVSGFQQGVTRAQSGITSLSKATEGFGQTAKGLYVPTSALESIAPAAEQAGQATKTMGGHMHNTGVQIGGFVGKLADMQTQMNLMFGGMALSGVFTVPFVKFTKAAFDASVGFESAFAGVRKTMDATEGEFKQLESNFRNMAKAVPTTAEEFARIGELAGQLGVRGVSGITAFSDVVSKLAVTTNLTTEQAATDIARFANIMQMPMSNVGRLGATIVDLGNKFATTEAEITDFAMRIAGAGKQVGLSEPQVLAFGAALSSVGINAEAGGTAISRVFVELSKAAASGGESLDLFGRVAGLSAAQFKQAFQTDAAGATLTFVQGLKQIQDSGGNVFAVLDKLGLDEIRVRDALLRTAGAGDLLSKSLGVANQAWKESTALNIEAAKRFGTTESQIRIMVNNFNELARTFGETFGPALNKVITGLTAVFQWMQRLPESVKWVVTGFFALLAAVGPVLLALSGLGAAALALHTGLPLLGKVLSVLVIPLKAVAGGFLAIQAAGGPLLWAIEALIAVGALLYVAWTKNWGNIQEKTRAWWEATSAGFSRLAADISAAWNSIKAKAWSAVVSIMDAVQPLLKWLPDSWAEGFEEMRQSAVQNMEAAQKAVEEAAARAEAASVRIKIAQDQVAAAWGKTSDVARSTADVTTVAYGKMMQSAWDEVKATEEANTRKRDDWSGFTGGVAQSVSEMVKKITDQYTLMSNIAQEKYSLIIASQRLNEDSMVALRAKSVMLSEQYSAQSQKVNDLRTAYENMVAIKGAAATESQEFLLELLKEETAQAKLAASIDETSKALKGMTDSMRKAAEEANSLYRAQLTGAMAAVSGGQLSYQSARTYAGSTLTLAQKRAAWEGIKRDYYAADSDTQAYMYRQQFGEAPPGLALGGNVLSPGSVLVGERGPELLNLPRGAQVSPLDRGGRGNITLNITINGSVGVDDIGEQIVRDLKRRGIFVGA